MKRSIICAAVLAVATVSTPSSAFDRTNTAQKGSILVFPRIDVSPGRDTLVRIENNYSSAVDVKCYWQNGTKQLSDIQFTLTKREPKVLVASETFPTVDSGLHPGPVDRGELKCWAVDAGGISQISWNHLSGSADIIHFDQPAAHRYSPWAFRCLSAALGQACGATPGVIIQESLTYDACPSYLTTGFSPTGAYGGLYGPSTLTVASCNQDLRQDRALYYTKLEFTVWREDETAYTGAYNCIDSWHETTLDDVANNPQNFSQFILGDNARFVVRGVPSIVCDTDDITTRSAGLVGVISTEIGPNVATTNLVGMGAAVGFILFDADDPIPEKN